MRRSWRWVVAVAVMGLLLVLPSLVGRVTAVLADSTNDRISAADLLSRIQASAGVPYAGYAESTGALTLPVTSQLSAVADLLSARTQLRVWWRGARDWRVDTVTAVGESDVHQQGSDVWMWNYENNEAVHTIDTGTRPVRLPAAADLLPTTLARRLLGEAEPSDVGRLPVRRIAGRDAAGLRLRPPQAGSTIDEVDVWADAGSGAALAVDVRGGASTVLSTRFLDFSPTRPAHADTGFAVPAGARERAATDPDLLTFIDRLGRARPPAALVGIARNPALPVSGSVGVYGRGITEFAATPLFGRTAGSLRRQLATTPGVSNSAAGQTLSVGPLTLVLTAEQPTPSDPDGDIGTSWLLSGTLTPAILTAAAAELVASGR